MYYYYYQFVDSIRSCAHPCLSLVCKLKWLKKNALVFSGTYYFQLEKPLLILGVEFVVVYSPNVCVLFENLNPKLPKS